MKIEKKCISERTMTNFILKILAVITFSLIIPTTSFSPLSSPSQCRASTELFQKGGKGFFANFMEELDAFVDDATNRRMGNGAAFYGKRKSEFYGENDSMKKKDKKESDPLEDYQGPKNAGYFQWMPDENGMLRPMTRMKKKNIERPQSFWDKAYKDDE